MFGSRESAKKVVFVNFWEQADDSKDVDDLIKEFETYFEASTLGIPTPIPVEQTIN